MWHNENYDKPKLICFFPLVLFTHNAFINLRVQVGEGIWTGEIEIMFLIGHPLPRNCGENEWVGSRFCKNLPTCHFEKNAKLQQTSSLTFQCPLLRLKIADLDEGDYPQAGSEIEDGRSK